ncbi:MAG: hypothetical protein ACFB15_31905 [Cyclobacteriaceae bacterium]
MKKVLSLLLGVGALGLALTSCEDEFTEEDALALQQENLINYEKTRDSLERVGGIIHYTVQVFDGTEVTSNARTESLSPSATVTAIQNGDTVTVNTGTEGLAFFDDMRIGLVTVRVESPNFTTAVFTADITPDNFESATVRNASTPIYIFPTTEANGAAVVTGKVEVETNLLNDTPELAVGATVRGYIDVNDGNFSGDYIYTGEAGGIRSIAYENSIAPATVGEDGTYRLIVPAGLGNEGNGLPIDIEFDNFEARQVLVRDGAVDTVDVLFGTGVTNSGIPTDAGIVATIPAPPAAGTGLEITATPISTTLSFGGGGNFDVEVMSGGAGYLNGQGDADDVSDDDGEIELVLNPDDDNTDNARAIFNVEDGRIVSFDRLENTGDATFSSAALPAVSTTLIDNGGQTAVAPSTAATFRVKYQGTYQLAIADGGSGYTFKPTVNILQTTFDDMNVGSTANNDLAQSVSIDEYDLSTVNGLEIVDGVITLINNAELKTIQGSAIEISEVVPMEREQAEIIANVNSDGEVDNIIIDNGGSGYDPAADLMITITSIVDGMGSGASYMVPFADIDADGEITAGNATEISRGSGYLINANRQDAQQAASGNVDQTLKPGQSFVYDFNYGVGKRVDE